MGNIKDAPQIDPSMSKDKRLSNAEYHARSEVNKSRLDEIAKSPAHYKAKFIDNLIPTSRTPALVLGSAYHKLQTEADDFFEDYCITPQINKRTKAGKEEWAAFEKENEGKELITEDQYSQIEKMVDAVNSHPSASKLMGLKGEAEKTIFWKDYQTGLKCKCRPDWLCKKDGLIIDLKTTEDASPEAFSRSINKFRYHVQAAFYTRGCELEDFVFVVVEKTPPHAVVCYKASSDMIAAGNRVADSNLDLLAKCQKSNRWPSYADTIINTDLPRWNND